VQSVLGGTFRCKCDGRRAEVFLSKKMIPTLLATASFVSLLMASLPGIVFFRAWLGVVLLAIWRRTGGFRILLIAYVGSLVY